MNSSTWYSWIKVNVSSTYLNRTEGWGCGLGGEQSLRILPYIGLLLWAKLLIPWLLRVSVFLFVYHFPVFEVGCFQAETQQSKDPLT